ncbi:MAG TPA: hypothetical protein VIC87_04915 [Vicinamibacteria bacterium]
MRRAWVLLLLGAVAKAEEPKFEQQEPAAELKRGQTYQGSSPAKRPYLYRVPEPGPRPPHLIVIFHGTGMSYQWGIGNYGVHEGYFRPHDFVLSPESEEPKRGFVQGKPDREDVTALIKLFRKTWPEIANVYLYGHSQGAFFCYYFAGEEPELIDGIVAHAGNFFKAKLAKQARDRVAIGILHGRADAVVTVQCAFDTDLVYREGDYKHVRLMIAEGLTDQTGHWPLPWHVPRMLAWCDRVAVKTPRAGAEAALEELAPDEPDLAAVAAAVAAGRKLLEKASAEEARGTADRLEALAALLDTARDALAASIAPAEANGAWATAFRIGQGAFGADPKWREKTAAVQKQALRHGDLVEKARKGLSKGKKGYAGGLDAARKAFLGEGYDHLLLHLSRWDKPGERVGEKELQEWKALAKELERFDKDGRADALRAWADALKAFRSDHEEWFLPYRPKQG